MLTVHHLAQLAPWFEAGRRLSNLPRVVCCLAVREGCNVSLMLLRMSASGTNVVATSCRKDFDTEERKVCYRAIDHVAERALAEFDAGKIRDLLRIRTDGAKHSLHKNQGLWIPEYTGNQ